jgi:hypothetical protein
MKKLVIAILGAMCLLVGSVAVTHPVVNNTALAGCDC